MTIRKVAAIVACVVLMRAQSALVHAQSTDDVLVEQFNTQGQTSGPDGYKWYDPTEAIAGAHDGFFEVVPPEVRTISEDALANARAHAQTPVSYTHLTLPTILLV